MLEPKRIARAWKSSAGLSVAASSHNTMSRSAFVPLLRTWKVKVGTEPSARITGRLASLASSCTVGCCGSTAFTALTTVMRVVLVGVVPK